MLKIVKFLFQIIERNNWYQMNDEAKIKDLLQEIIAGYPSFVLKAQKDLKKGKERGLVPIMNILLEKTNKCVNAKLAKKILIQLLGAM